MKLVNGEEALAAMTENLPSEYMRVSNPVRVLCSANLDGSMSTMYIPWNLMGEAVDLKINYDRIVVAMPAAAEAKRQYERYWKDQAKREEFLQQNVRDQNMAYDLMMIEPGGSQLKH